MTYEEKAKIILEKMDKFIQVDWNFEKYYLQGIIDGLKEIDHNSEEGTPWPQVGNDKVKGTPLTAVGFLFYFGWLFNMPLNIPKSSG